MKYFIYSIIGVVAAAIVAGFFIVDSPAKNRMKRFDEQRVGNLQLIQGEILNYWMKKSSLPKTLADLRDDVRGFSVPPDPESGEFYGYEVKSKYMFSLCADFKTVSENWYQYSQGSQKPFPRPMEYGGYLSDDWKHGIGHTCFERTIDPELYPPLKK